MVEDLLDTTFLIQVSLGFMARRKRKKEFPASSFFNAVKARSVKKKKIIKRILLLLAFGFLAYRFITGPYGFIEIHSLWKEKGELEKQSRVLDAEIVDKEIEKQRLTDDDFYLEKQARERLRMVKEGEKLYQIVDTKKSDRTKVDQIPEPSSPDSLSP
jgi:cell division protein FtsB